MVTFHEAVGGLTGSAFRVPSIGFAKYRVLGKFTYVTANTQIVYEFEAKYDYTDINIRFNVDPFLYQDELTPGEIKIVNPLQGFTYTWRATNANGNPSGNVLWTGTSFTTTYFNGEGRKFYVEAYNGLGCKLNAYIKREVIYTPLTGVFNLAQDCRNTTILGSNPNLILPSYSKGEIDPQRITYRWYSKTQWDAIVNSNPNENGIYLIGDGISISPQNTSLNVTNLPDFSEYVCVIFDQGRVYEDLTFTVFGDEEYYEDITANYYKKNIVFKQRPLTTNPQTAYKGDVFNKRLWQVENSNFRDCRLEFKSCNVLVLTEKKSFNRFVFNGDCIVTINGNSTIKSTCHTWGGIYIGNGGVLNVQKLDENQTTYYPTIANANVGVCVMRNIDEGGTNPLRQDNLSITFPFIEDSETAFNDATTINIDGGIFFNNYFHIYSLSPMKNGYIKNSSFDCNPSSMLYPYEPKIIDGREQFTVTEAAIVGHSSNYTNSYFFNTNSSGLYNSIDEVAFANTQIENNGFGNCLYGILNPGCGIQNLNIYKDIYLSGIRYFGTPNISGHPISIKNQRIRFSKSTSDYDKVSRQINNLNTYWNSINGFYEPTIDFLGSSNIAKVGLSTGLIKHQGQDVTYPIGIYVNNEEDYEVDGSQELTFPNLSSYPSTRGAAVEFENNQLFYEERQETIPAVGILAGSTYVIVNNTIASFHIGASVNYFRPRSSGSNGVVFSENRFLNNLSNLIIKPVVLDVSGLPGNLVRLKCNYFETNNAPDSKGIIIKNGCPVINFGSYTTFPSISYSLSSNVWPVSVGTNRSITPVDADNMEMDVNDAWQSPSNWTSIVNENTTNSGLVNYYRYKNEFVGRVIPDNPTVLNVNAPDQLLKAYTTANTAPVTGTNYELVCSGTMVTQAVYFPTPSIRIGGGTTTKPKQNIEIGVSNNDVSVVIKGGETLNYIQVSDLLGRVIGKYNHINATNFTLPASEFQKGVYIINVLDSKGRSYTTKLQR